MHRPAVSRIEPRAARYLELLVEFGHLEPRVVEEIILDASDAYAATGLPIPLSAVQRLAALELVGESTPSPGGTDILSEDWPLLFF